MEDMTNMTESGNENFFIELLHSIWNSIKRFFVRCLNFAKNIVSFFKNPGRFRKLKENKETTIAVAIKENLENGNYNTVNCLFNKVTNKVEDLEVNAEGIESEDLDYETRQAFGDRAMIILQ